jgi:predicted nucleotidyltransferase
MRRRNPLPVEIRQRLATLGCTLGACPEVLFAYAFGGAVGGELRPLSDVDVAVYLDEATDAFECKWELLMRITAHLGTDEVDLVVLNHAPTAFAGRILQRRQVLYERDPFRRQRFESLVLREYFDFRVFEHRLLTRRYAGG